MILEFIARRRIESKAKRFIRGTGSERGSVGNGPRLDRYDITSTYGFLFVSSIPDTGGPRACVRLFGNGSSMCYLYHVQKQTQKKRGSSNKFNIMIKHMHTTDHGIEISSDASPDRGRDTMMLVIVKRITSGRTLGGLAAGTQRYFEYVGHLVSHWGNSSGERRKIFGAKNVLVYIVHSVFWPQGLAEKCVGLLLVETHMVCFEHKDLQKNALDCCWLKCQRYYRIFDHM